MNTYFLKFQVVPTEANEHYSLVKGALAFCWVVENDAQSAYAKGDFFVTKYDWKIEKIDTFPVEVTKEHFLEKDIGIEQYNKAQEEGIAIVYSAWAKDGKTTAGPMVLNPSNKFNLSEYLGKQKQLKKKGRCLHYNGNHRCKEIINAHSIQKNQSLEAISDNGHVYILSSDIGSLKKNRGRLTYKKRGVNRVSTFLGFCRKHDNELFEPIDNLLLFPTNQQVFLYAYRSLCRELFVKENALALFEDQLRKMPEMNPIKELLFNTKTGTAFGLKNLRNHKTVFDNSLKKKSYFDIKYVLFVSKQKSFIAFSGLFYPDFDFMGRQLQNLGNHKSKLDLIAICTAPVDSGWGVLFSWHDSSSNVCREFMSSLATMAYEGNRLGDLIFRMAISNCENLAIAPNWWEKLPENHKEQITSRATLMANIFSTTKPSYLMEGIEGIAPWNFESVIDNMN